MKSDYHTNEDKYNSFNSDSAIVVIHNCANSHIWNNQQNFVNFRDLAEVNNVATIGGQNHYPVRIGSVYKQIPSVNGKIGDVKLENVLYIPNSPVKMISLVCLGNNLDDSEGTFISTRRFRSSLKWDKDKFERELQHPGSRLPKINVNPGCNLDLALCTSLNTVSETGTAVSLRTTLSEDMFDASDKLCTISVVVTQVEGLSHFGLSGVYASGQSEGAHES